MSDVDVAAVMRRAKVSALRAAARNLPPEWDRLALHEMGVHVSGWLDRRADAIAEGGDDEGDLVAFVEAVLAAAHEAIERERNRREGPWLPASVAAGTILGLAERHLGGESS